MARSIAALAAALFATQIHVQARVFMQLEEFSAPGCNAADVMFRAHLDIAHPSMCDGPRTSGAFTYYVGQSCNGSTLMAGAYEDANCATLHPSISLNPDHPGDLLEHGCNNESVTKSVAMTCLTVPDAGLESLRIEEFSTPDCSGPKEEQTVWMVQACHPSSSWHPGSNWTVRSSSLSISESAEMRNDEFDTLDCSGSPRPRAQYPCGRCAQDVENASKYLKVNCPGGLVRGTASASDRRSPWVLTVTIAASAAAVLAAAGLGAA
mmetsp:Transcript_101815/g.263129  ORF Transcript_101815/g.263129 Transcript_101815/m.263129 type:complete len:265 (-) Transcript_101815:520-1314(-)